nr:hypothetical protein [Nocardioides aquaticus]
MTGREGGGDVEPAAVVADHGDHLVRGLLDADVEVRPAAVAHGVAHGLLDRAPGERDQVRGQVVVDLHGQGGGDPVAAQGGEEVVKGTGQPGGVEVRWVDLDQQGAQCPDAAAHRAARVVELGAQGAARVRSGGDGGQHVRRAGQLLDDPVVEVPRDPGAFGVRGVDRGPQQPLALLGGPAEPTGEEHDERQCHRDECTQPDQGHGPEPAQDRVGAVADAGGGVVRLEEEGLALR